MQEVMIKIKNEEGLHARPASVFSKVCMKIKSDIKVYKNGDESKGYNPKSILGVLTMQACKGDELKIVVEGEDEETAVKTLKELAEREFVQ